MSYEITCSITAVCPCCGKDLPSHSYLTVSKPTGSPLYRDNPYERTARRVFITPCADCYQPRAHSHDDSTLGVGVDHHQTFSQDTPTLFEN